MIIYKLKFFNLINYKHKKLFFIKNIQISFFLIKYKIFKLKKMSSTSLSDFKKEKVIGQGSFGSVYLVRRLEDNKQYAMKTVLLDKLDKNEQENSVNEVRILASINHPNVIGYKETFWNDKNKSINIIMEYADGGDLQSKIEKMRLTGEMFSESIIWEYAIQMIKGLKALHDKKIMHRDIKSANIFLFKDKRLCKIGDMNVSKVIKNKVLLTQTGTPYYASPEVWNDEPYSYKSDLWSIGCVIYELCELHPPFNGKDFDELYANVCEGNPERIDPVYSDDLWKMILMLLQVDVKKRYDCNKFLNDKFIKWKIIKMRKYNNNSCYLNSTLLSTIKFNNINEIKSQLPTKKNYCNVNTAKKQIALVNTKKTEYNSLNKIFKNEKIFVSKYSSKNVKSEKNIAMNLKKLQQETEKSKLNISKNQVNHIKNQHQIIKSKNKIYSKDNKNNSKNKNIEKRNTSINKKKYKKFLNKNSIKKIIHNNTEIFQNIQQNDERARIKKLIKLNKIPIFKNNRSESNIQRITTTNSNDKEKMPSHLSVLYNDNIQKFIQNTLNNVQPKNMKHSLNNKKKKNLPITSSPTAKSNTKDRRTNFLSNDLVIKKICPSLIRKNNSYTNQSHFSRKYRIIANPISSKSKKKKIKIFKKIQDKIIFDAFNQNKFIKRSSNSSDNNKNNNSNYNYKIHNSGIINSEISLLNNSHNSNKIHLTSQINIIDNNKKLKLNGYYKKLRNSPSYLNYHVSSKERSENKSNQKKLDKSNRNTKCKRNRISDVERETVILLGSFNKSNNNLDDINLTSNNINNNLNPKPVIIICNNMKENKKNAKINFSQVEGIKNKDLSPKNSTSQIYNNFYSINSDESINIPIKVINLYK